MEIMKNLCAKYSWEEIEPVLLRLYPTPKRNIAEYREAYQKFVAIVPIKTSMRIVIEERDDTGFDKWHEVYGRDETLVKDVFRTDHGNIYLKDNWENEQDYALSYTSWAEIAGMIIDQNTLSSYAEKDVLVHVLMEITRRWRTDEQDLKVAAELEAIVEGRVQNLIQKDKIGKKGFRQVWSEKENGEFHGLYTVYWDNGVMYQQGIINNGNKEGIWTYWDKNGKIKNQMRYWCDREMELKSESPWWNNTTDQNRT